MVENVEIDKNHEDDTKNGGGPHHPGAPVLLSFSNRYPAARSVPGTRRMYKECEAKFQPRGSYHQLGRSSLFFWLQATEADGPTSARRNVLEEYGVASRLHREARGFSKGGALGIQAAGKNGHSFRSESATWSYVQCPSARD